MLVSPPQVAKIARFECQVLVDLEEKTHIGLLVISFCAVCLLMLQVVSIVICHSKSSSKWANGSSVPGAVLLSPRIADRGMSRVMPINQGVTKSKSVLMCVLRTLPERQINVSILVWVNHIGTTPPTINQSRLV
jgi:hypothetical protein